MGFQIGSTATISGAVAHIYAIDKIIIGSIEVNADLIPAQWDLNGVGQNAQNNLVANSSATFVFDQLLTDPLVLDPQALSFIAAHLNKMAQVSIKV